MAGRWLELLARCDRAGRFVENTLLLLMLGGLMVVSVGQILLREGFNFGFIWANELQNLMVLWLAMVATVAACRDNRHIRIDVLTKAMPAAMARAARTFVDLFAAAVCIAIAWQVYRYLQIEIEYGDKVMFDVPAWLAHSILPLAFFLSGYRFLVSAIKAATGQTDASGDPA